MKQIKVAVVGGTGYTGAELIRLLISHPNVDLTVVTSRSEAGVALSHYFPSLRNVGADIKFNLPDQEAFAEVDLVFFATPHAAAMRTVPALLSDGKRVIDLSADFRIQNVALWEQWYGVEHVCPELLPSAVYGLPELNRDKIKGANLIANPGCYPTSVQLALLPLLKAGLIDIDDIVADCKSGVSGAGRNAKVGNLFCEAGENFKAYGVAGHRHLPEILQGLEIIAKKPVAMTFVPHLLPMSRGIESSVYATLTEGSLACTEKDLYDVFQDSYSSEPFVDVLPSGMIPDTRSVRGVNTCRLSVFRPLGKRKLVISSVIDNLIKGAAGQAVQNMNICYGWPESMGLNELVVWP